MFIGRGTGFNNQLQYREKDGNLRPKKWSDMENNITYFPNLYSFQKALVETAQYRSERIVLKHIDILDKVTLQNIKNHINELLDK